MNIFNNPFFHFNLIFDLKYFMFYSEALRRADVVSYNLID